MILVERIVVKKKIIHDCEKEFKIRAGLPTTVDPGGTFLVTTEHAPTIAPSPIIIPGRIKALAPINAPEQIVIGLVSKDIEGSLKSWVAVQTYTSCATQAPE